MSSFGLRVLSSDRVFFEGRVNMLVLPAPDGEAGILAHHADMVIAVQNGEMRFQTEDGEWHYAVVGTGLAEVINNRALVLVDTAERPEEIDEKRAQEALEQAQEELRQKQSIEEYYVTQATLARALSRLKEKNRHGNINN